jgi:hypothetical protein
MSPKSPAKGQFFGEDIALEDSPSGSTLRFLVDADLTCTVNALLLRGTQTIGQWDPTELADGTVAEERLIPPGFHSLQISIGFTAPRQKTVTVHVSVVRTDGTTTEDSVEFKGRNLDLARSLADFFIV